MGYGKARKVVDGRRRVFAAPEREVPRSGLALFFFVRSVPRARSFLLVTAVRIEEKWPAEMFVSL